jgi:hypothetical protein
MAFLDDDRELSAATNDLDDWFKLIGYGREVVDDGQTWKRKTENKRKRAPSQGQMS